MNMTNQLRDVEQTSRDSVRTFHGLLEFGIVRHLVMVAISSLMLVVAPVKAATLDGWDIPTDFAGKLVAKQGLATNLGASAIGGVVSRSELDQLFVDPDVSDGFLKIGITGQIDATPGLDADGFTIFLDTRVGGESTLDANGGVQPYGSRFVTALEGTTFDTGFAPDFGLVINAAGLGFTNHWTDLIDLDADTNRFIGRGDFGTGSGVLNPLFSGDPGD